MKGNYLVFRLNCIINNETVEIMKENFLIIDAQDKVTKAYRKVHAAYDGLIKANSELIGAQEELVEALTQKQERLKSDGKDMGKI
jgi:hypothetical protein